MSHCPFSRLNHGIAGSVFLKQELVNIANCKQVGPKRVFATRHHSPSLAFSNEDSRFDRTMDMRTGYFTRSMIVAGALGEAEIS